LCGDKTDDAHRVDFGLDTARRLGLTSRKAIYQACPKRFQPIIMSTMAAMFGAVPLA
jgi:multidrug efflux pump